MTALLRYPRLAYHCARYSLLREMAFRGNFLLRTIAELGSLVLIITFFWVIYGQTDHIAGWTKYQVLFLLGTHYIIVAVFQAFFFDNILSISDQIRTGGLDFALLKPVDSQFLLSIKQINYTPLVQSIAGFVMIGYAIDRLGISPTFTNVALYLMLLASGIVIVYSIMFMLATTSFWLIRNENIFDLWWYVNHFSRYPADIYSDFLGGVFRILMTYILPVMIIANVPAAAVVRADFLAGHLIFVAPAAAIVFFTASRLLFHFGLRYYQSASS